jgi:hypothetical protein
MTVIGRRSFLQVAGATLSSSLFADSLLASLSTPTQFYTAPAITPVSEGDGGSTAEQESPAKLALIIAIAASSDISRYHWKDRGLAPAGYTKGMAIIYARMCSELKRGGTAATEMATANTGNLSTDALAWYNEQCQDAGMDNHVGGIDVLRHLFVLLTGLGMRESSGKYCAGRDRSAMNTTAETAEAGLFQTSYNARAASPVLSQLFKQYAGSTDLVEVFREGVSCKSSDLENCGVGEGHEFQHLSKSCPAFAVEFAAVALRKMRKHWGPINTRAAEVRPECDQMLKQVQEVIDE